MIGTGLSRTDVLSRPPTVLDGDGAGHLRDVGVLAELERGLAGLRAELGRVLPDADDLGAEGDAVEGGLVAVLAADLDLAALVRR